MSVREAWPPTARDRPRQSCRNVAGRDRGGWPSRSAFLSATSPVRHDAVLITCPPLPVA